MKARAASLLILVSVVTAVAGPSQSRAGDVPQRSGGAHTFHDVVLSHHIALGGPQAWKDRPERPGFTFFQGPGETNLIQQGARANLGTASPSGRGPAGLGNGVAPVEGQAAR